MWATTELLRFAAAIVALLFAALLLRDHRRNPTARASVALLAGVAAHLLFLPLLRHGAWQPVVHTVLLVSLTVPVALRLLAHLHCDDDFRFGGRHAWALAAFVTVGYVCWLGAVERRLPALLFPTESTRFWILLPKLLGLAVVLHALLRVDVGGPARTWSCHGCAPDSPCWRRVRSRREARATLRGGAMVKGGRARAGVPLSPLRAHRSRGHREDHGRASTPRCLPVSCSPPRSLEEATRPEQACDAAEDPSAPPPRSG